MLAFARAEGFACVEAMCWPVGRAERKDAGVTHVDVTDFSAMGGGAWTTTGRGFSRSGPSHFALQCIEVEDETFGTTLAGRQRALRLARDVLEPLMGLPG